MHDLSKIDTLGVGIFYRLLTSYRTNRKRNETAFVVSIKLIISVEKGENRKKEKRTKYDNRPLK